MEMHNELGTGMLEAIYQEALAIELSLRNIPFQKEAQLTCHYKNQELIKKHFADFICYHKIILEIKAVNELDDSHFSQILNYLNITKSKLGLLINFGGNSLEYKRVIV